MKGVPVRIELGPRDIEAGKMTVSRRDGYEKTEYALADAETTVAALLREISESLYERAKRRMEERIVSAETLQELLDGVNGGSFVRAGWCGDRACEDKVKEFAQATSRVACKEHTACKCVACGKKAKTTLYFARAY